MRQKEKQRSKRLLIPECVRGEVALTPTGGFKFDKSPTRGIKGAHEGNADTEYHEPVACNDSCKRTPNIIHIQT